jgi:carbonic anhydrase
MVKNMTIYNENLFISHAMHKCEGKTQTPINLDIKNKETNLKKIIYNDFDRFINFIHKLDLEIKHNDKTIDYEHTSTTTLTLKTTCFKVDINDNFAKLTPLK